MIGASVSAAAYAGGDFRVVRVLIRTAAVFSRNFLTFFAVTAVAALPDLLVFNDGAAAWDSGMMWLFLHVFIIAVSSALAEAVVLYGAFEDMRGRRANLAKSIRVGLGRPIPVVGLAILTGLGIVVGVFFLVVPGLVLLITWFVATPACVVERLGPSESMERSTHLTRGYRWKIFGMVLFLIVADQAGAFALDAVLRLGGSAVLTKLGTFTWNAAWAAFYAVIGVVTYHDLRVAKEGIDIHEIASVFD